MLGRTVGPYEIIGKLGEGGMGEVYRARDTRLNRDVALKILPEALAGDADRLARFRREAQVLAALNHPNVAHLYGFEEAPGTAPALVMELVDGPTLSEVIGLSAPGPKGPGLHLNNALHIARQIAEALEAAHEQGIVHRDLKPANIKVREDGTVKVLDFGLAKAMDPDQGPAKAGHYDLANSPTLTARATQMGMILGTAAYMAPEQAKGKAVDKRADIWAFGVVFYEMLTGKCPFIAETVPETLAHVITREIDTTALPASTPPQIRKLIASCLVKDPKMRLRDIGDARLILGEPVTAPDGTPLPKPAPLPPPFMARFLLPTAGVLFAFSLFALIYSSFTRPSPDTTSIHLSIAMPQGEQLTTVPAVSPDGKTIVYAAGRTNQTSRLYLRALDSFDARPVPSSEGAVYPFFSPDGRAVAFFAGGKMWRMPVAGGTPQIIAAAGRPWGGAWLANGTIVFVPNLTSGLWSVSDGGGTAVQLTKPDGAGAGYAHSFPQRIGASSDVLFTFWGQTFYTALLDAKTGTWRPVVTPQPLGSTRTSAVYAANGYLVSGDGTSGMAAVPWSPSMTTPVTPETAVIDSAHWITGAERSWFNVSENGTAIYAPGSPTRKRLVWVDRHGAITEVPGEPDAVSGLALSRDGTKVVRPGRSSLWIEDLTAGTRTRILSDRFVFSSGFLPDGSVVVSSNKDGDWDLYAASPNGGGQMAKLLKKPYPQHPMSVGSDGSIVFTETHPSSSVDLWILPPGGQPRVLTATPFNESNANLSPANSYVAYMSDESGRYEIYALPVSGKGDRVTVSTGGGSGPVWSRDGREIFYRAGDDLVSVEIKSMNPLTLGARKKLLDISAYEPGYFHDFDVSPDGQRFLLIRSEPDARPTKINVITNWFSELERLVKK